MTGLLQKFYKLLSKLLWQIDIPVKNTSSDSLHVDLGSGNMPRNPFAANRVIATDFHSSFVSKDGYEFIQSDLTKKLPFEDNSITSISAYDVLEHIPRWDRTVHGIEFPFISLMNEIYRVLRPGGIFLAVMPAFPNEEAFKDPTHVNIVSKSTIQYFALPEPWANLLGYGFENGFYVETQCWLRGEGPYLSSSLISTWDKSNFFQRTAIIVKLFLRILRLKKRKRNCPLLWVLRKP